MADVQTEKGYTKIANMLLEAIYRSNTNYTAIRILLLILRKSYGYQKKTCLLNIRKMGRELNIHYANIAKTIALLEKLHIIKREKKGNMGTEISIIKDFETWEIKTRKKINFDKDEDKNPGIGVVENNTQQSLNTLRRAAENTTPELAETLPGSSENGYINKENIKEIFKENYKKKEGENIVNDVQIGEKKQSEENGIKDLTENERNTIYLFVTYMGLKPGIGDYAIMEKIYEEFDKLKIEEAFIIARERLGQKINLRYVKGILKNKRDNDNEQTFNVIS